MPTNNTITLFGANDDPEKRPPETEVLVGDTEAATETIYVPEKDEDVALYDPEELELPTTVDFKSDVEDTTEEDYFSLANIKNLYLMLTEKYGENFLTWEPETLEIVVKDDLDLKSLPDLLWSSLQAIRTVGGDGPWQDYLAFEKAVAALSGSPVYVDQLQDISAEDILSVIKVMEELHPDKIFSEEVQRYIAGRLYSQGYLYCGNQFPSEIQDLILELGAPPTLIKETHSKIIQALENKDEPLPKFIEGLTDSAVDIQVARYIALL